MNVRQHHTEDKRHHSCWSSRACPGGGLAFQACSQVHGAERFFKNYQGGHPCPSQNYGPLLGFPSYSLLPLANYFLVCVLSSSRLCPPSPFLLPPPEFGNSAALVSLKAAPSAPLQPLWHRVPGIIVKFWHHSIFWETTWALKSNRVGLNPGSSTQQLCILGDIWALQCLSLIVCKMGKSQYLSRCGKN